jgi:hypothetical protein
LRKHQVSKEESDMICEQRAIHGAQPGKRGNYGKTQKHIPKSFHKK